MAIIVDVLLIALFVFCVFRGAKIGFVKTISGLITLLLSLVLTFLLTPALADRIDQRYVRHTVVDKVSTSLVRAVGGDNAEKFDKMFSDETSPLAKVTERFQADFEDIRRFYNKLDKSSYRDEDERIIVIAEDTVDTDAASSLSDSSYGDQKEKPTLSMVLAEKIAPPISHSISYLLSALFIFLGCLVVLAIVFRFIDLAAKLPLLNTINSSLGGVAGAIRGLCWVLVISVLLGKLIPYLSAMKPGVIAADFLDGSYVMSVLRSVDLFSLLS